MVWPDQNDVKYNLPWEWNSKDALRNTIYPGFVSLPFFFLKFFKLDFRYVVIMAPKIQHLTLFLLGYFCFYKYLKTEFGKYIAKISILMLIANFANQLMMTRTFSNSLEALLFCIGLYLVSRIKDGKNWKGSAFTFNSVMLTVIVSASLMIRNSSVMTWIPILVDKVFVKRNFMKMFVNFFFIGLPTLALAIGLDSLYYESFVLTPWNFLKFNVIDNGSANYGVEHYLWYVLKVLPMWANFFLPFTLIGGAIYGWHCVKNLKFPFIIITIITCATTLSMVPHKEERFILSLLPMLTIFAAIGISAFKNWSRSIKLLLTFSFIVSTISTATLGITTQQYEAEDFLQTLKPESIQ